MKRELLVLSMVAYGLAIAPFSHTMDSERFAYNGMIRTAIYHIPESERNVVVMAPAQSESFSGCLACCSRECDKPSQGTMAATGFVGCPACGAAVGAGLGAAFCGCGAALTGALIGAGSGCFLGTILACCYARRPHER